MATNYLLGAGVGFCLAAGSAFAEDAWEADPAQSVYEDLGAIPEEFSPIELGRDNPLFTSALIDARMHAMRGDLKGAMNRAPTTSTRLSEADGDLSRLGVCSVAAGPNTRVVINNCLVNGAIIGGR